VTISDACISVICVPKQIERGGNGFTNADFYIRSVTISDTCINVICVPKQIERGGNGFTNVDFKSNP
jgi:hypothetical protein